MIIPCGQRSMTPIIKPSQNKTPRYVYEKAKSGLLEPVPLSRRRRWSRCPNPVRTASLPTGPMNPPAGRWSG